MYSAIKDWFIQYILDYEPTQEQLDELDCDSYEEYNEPVKIETEQEKKSRIRELVVYQPILSEVSLEWVEFSDREIGDIIVDRVFGGNPHAQTALQAKYLASLTNNVFWVELTEEDEAIFARADEVRIQINAIRNKLSLDNI